MEKEKFLWDHFYPKKSINIKDVSAYEYMKEETKDYGHLTAIKYFGKKISYNIMWEYINKCACAFKSLGVRKGDIVTICMPNTPEAIIAFFAINKVGGVVNLIHPLSAEEEIKDYLNKTESGVLLAYNGCYSKIRNIIKDTSVYKVIISSPSDSMPVLLNHLYKITKGRKEEKPKHNSLYMFWSEFLRLGDYYDGATYVERSSEDLAVIMHSGGTTGNPKSIMLANKSFINIVEISKICFYRVKEGDSMLSILPFFHCFGLVVCMYVPVCMGLTSILVPQFDAKRFDKLITRYKPTCIIGVPTLYEAMINNKHMANVSFENIKYFMCGGDKLSDIKNKELNDFIHSRGGKYDITQGFGMTESAGPVIFGAMEGSDKLGSIGAPLIGTITRICDPKTGKELKPLETGEICIYSPGNMLGYYKDEGSTKEALKKHSDGRYYIHSGDLGYMDEDGVVFYVQRMKRIIVSSGYNVYPQYIEEVLRELPFVDDVCVVGVPHPYKKEVPKAFIKLKKNTELTYTIKKNIMDYAKKNLAHYMIPKEYVFKDDFPKTKLGKIDFKKLQDELIKK